MHRKQSRFKVKRSWGKTSQLEGGGGKSCFNGKANGIEKEKINGEIKRLEMEMNQKQFELKQQLELAKLEADRDISKAKEKTELAEL